MMRLLILGPQGSGKSTQSKMLAQKHNYCLVYTGDILRSKASEETQTGREVKEHIARGTLAEDEIVCKLIEEWVTHHNCDHGFVVDGYPRRLSQLKIYDPEFNLVIYLKIPDEEVIKRMIKRGRSDDEMPQIKKRLEVFHISTEGVIKHYDQIGILKVVDARQSIEKIAEEIEKIVEEKSGQH